MSRTISAPITLRGKARGEAHGSAKLTADIVRLIRKSYLAGDSMATLGRRFSVSRQSIRAILLRETWDHVQD